MARLTLELADKIVDAALRHGREKDFAPLSVAVLDPGGHLIAFKREDRSGILRFDIAFGKAWGALGMGMDSRALGTRAEQNPRFFAALGALSAGRVIPNAGGLLLHGADGASIGAIGVSGDQAERDEAVALEAMRGLGLAGAESR